VSFGCSLSKDFCCLIWCPPSLFGPNVCSCCSGSPLEEYLGQKLALWFGDQDRKHLPVGCWLSKICFVTHSVSGKPDDWLPAPDLLCQFDSERPGLPPPVLSAASEIDGQ